MDPGDGVSGPLMYTVGYKEKDKTEDYKEH